MKKYTALMVDIVSSRNGYDDRNEVQEVFKATITFLNEKYNKDIEKKVMISNGDEAQGLFNNVASAYYYIREMSLLLYPIIIRGSLGYGEIDNNYYSSIETTGEAYYKARDAMNQHKKSKESNKKQTKVILNINNYNKYLNVMCDYSALIKNMQSPFKNLIEVVFDTKFPLYETNYSYSYFGNDDFKKIIDFKIKNLNKHKKEVINIKFENLVSDRFIERNIDGIEFKFQNYNLQTKILNVIETTSQNLNKHIKSGNIMESRISDYAIYNLIKEGVNKC